jgi:hypothetical protein
LCLALYHNPLIQVKVKDPFLLSKR